MNSAKWDFEVEGQEDFRAFVWLRGCCRDPNISCRNTTGLTGPWTEAGVSCLTLPHGGIPPYLLLGLPWLGILWRETEFEPLTPNPLFTLLRKRGKPGVEQLIMGLGPAGSFTSGVRRLSDPA